MIERASTEEVEYASVRDAQKRRRTMFCDEADEARQHPGVWFKLSLTTYPWSGQRAYQIRTGGLTSFRPSGSFEAMSSGNKNFLLFRYVGEVVSEQ